MSSNLPALYVEAWAEPRKSMRRILGLSLAERDRIIMVAITFVLFAIPFAMALRGTQMPDGRIVTTGVILQISAMLVAVGMIGYYITAALIKAFGGVFGGTASYDDCKSVSAWSQLVTGLANLAIFVLSFVLPGAIGLALRVFLGVAAAFILSAYIAEAHGFKSVAKVFGVVLGASVMIGLMLVSMLPPEMLRAPQ